MNDLLSAIKTVMPSLVEEWNNKKLAQFEQLVEQKFEQYFEGRQTQEKTKMVAPILDSVFARLMKPILAGFAVDEGKGRDYIWNTIPLESKITFGAGKSWTGNGYAKTPWHILMRFEITDEGVITGYFATLVNLDNCASKWTVPPADKAKTSNFSTLTFLKEDSQHLLPIHGVFTSKNKYLNPEMVNV